MIDINHGNAIIERGYYIYNGWKKNRWTSHMIVECVKHEFSLMNRNETAEIVEALSHLFALELRIKARYRSLLLCLFRFSSWRCETRTFKSLKGNFSIYCSEALREAIESEIEELRSKRKKKIKALSEEDKDGGKKGEKSEEEVEADKVEKEETASEERTEENTEVEEKEEVAEEAVEETAEQTNEQTKTEQKTAENGEMLEVAEPSQAKSEEAPRGERSQSAHEAHSEQKTENNGHYAQTAPITDAVKKSEITDHTIDIIPPNEPIQSEKKAEETSFIDEVIMDNMVKGKDNYVNHNPLADVGHTDREIKDSMQALENTLQTLMDSKKEDFLYDEMIENNITSPTQDTEKSPSPQQTEETPQSNETPKNMENAKDVGFHESLDILNGADNKTRMDYSFNLSSDEVQTLHDKMVENMREKLNITYSELGIKEEVDIIGSTDSPKINPPSLGPSRK